MGEFCLLVELHRERSSPAARAAGWFIYKFYNLFYTRICLATSQSLWENYFSKVIVCSVLLQMETNNLGKHLVKSYLSTYFTLVPGCLFYSVWQIISTRVTKLKRPRPF